MVRSLENFHGCVCVECVYFPGHLVCVSSVYIKVTVVNPLTSLIGVRQKGGLLLAAYTDPGPYSHVDSNPAENKKNPPGLCS